MSRRSQGRLPRVNFSCLPDFLFDAEGATPARLIVAWVVIRACGAGYETRATRDDFLELGRGLLCLSSLADGLAWLRSIAAIERVRESGQGWRTSILWRRAGDAAEEPTHKQAGARQAGRQTSTRARARRPPGRTSSPYSLRRPENKELNPSPLPVSQDPVAHATATPEGTGRDGFLKLSDNAPGEAPDAARLIAAGWVGDPPDPAEVAEWRRLGALPGPPGLAARVKLTLWEQVHDRVLGKAPPPRPVRVAAPAPARPEPAEAPAVEATPGRRTYVPRDPAYPRAAALAMIRGPRSADQDHELGDRFARHLAGRWRDVDNPITLRKFAEAFRVLEAEELAGLVVESDGRGVRDPAHFFAKSLREPLARAHARRREKRPAAGAPLVKVPPAAGGPYQALPDGQEYTR
jgi:hypothetical protein